MCENETLNEIFDYQPNLIKNACIGNIINNNEIEIYITGDNQNKTKSFLHYFTFKKEPKYEKQVKEDTLLFQIWNYSPSQSINYIIPIESNSIQSISDNNIFFNTSYLFKSSLEILISKNKEDFEIYNLDNEIYNKPCLEQQFILGLISNIGLKIFDVIKKETKSILYPGKKHIIYDYFNSLENNCIFFSCEDKKIYMYDKNDKNSLISRINKMDINMLSEGSNDGKKFYAYSEEERSLYLYDIRNLNQFVDIVKSNIEISKMIYNKNSQRLYILEFGSEAIISLNDDKQESIYESKSMIKDFSFHKNKNIMNIISEDNFINIINF